MLKKVSLSNVNTGRTNIVLVDTDTDEKALTGSGKAPNELAKVMSLEGGGEVMARVMAKKGSIDDRAILFAGVARCLERNIPAIKSFELQANRVKSPRYRGIIAEIAYQISIGEKLSEAMARFPKEFGPEITALIRAGEESGRLPVILTQLGESQKKTMRIIKKLKKGMIYPAVVSVIAIAVVILMSVTLVPAMTKLYADFGSELPWATKLLIKLSNVLIHTPWMLGIPLFAIYQVFKNWGRIVKNTTVQKLFVATPVIGTIVRKSAAAVSFRCLSLLLESGVRMNTSLQITAESATNYYYKEFFSRIRTHIADGRGMSESFIMESHWLGEDGRVICGIMDIAGETGSATEMLDEVAADYEEELDAVAGQIDKLMEPLTMVVLGVIVGFLVYAIYSPVFNLSSVILPKGK